MAAIAKCKLKQKNCYNSGNFIDIELNFGEIHPRQALSANQFNRSGFTALVITVGQNSVCPLVKYLMNQYIDFNKLPWSDH